MNEVGDRLSKDVMLALQVAGTQVREENKLNVRPDIQHLALRSGRLRIPSMPGKINLFHYQ